MSPTAVRSTRHSDAQVKAIKELAKLSAEYLVKTHTDKASVSRDIGKLQRHMLMPAKFGGLGLRMADPDKFEGENADERARAAHDAVDAGHADFVRWIKPEEYRQSWDATPDAMLSEVVGLREMLGMDYPGDITHGIETALVALLDKIDGQNAKGRGIKVPDGYDPRPRDDAGEVIPKGDRPKGR